jgi:hypothetical protein
MMLNVRHCHVVRCLGVCTEPPNFYLMMEPAKCNLKEARQSWPRSPRVF